MISAPASAEAPVVVAQSLASAAGVGLHAFAQHLRANRSALRPNTFSHPGVQAVPSVDPSAAPPAPLATWVGEVPDLLALGRLPPALSAWDCRASRLAWLGLQADGMASAVARARQQLGAARVGLVLGTSASTIGVSEQAYRRLDAQGRFPLALRSESLNTIHAITAFVQQALGLEGPAATVSTACSSSAKAFAQAARWLYLGVVDAVLVGGVDALCDSVLYGFHALQLVSPQPCQPFAATRCGISVGEAAGFALLQRGEGSVQLLGWGEANDAHHMSSPHPQGLGAEKAVRAALARAGVTAHAVQYLSLHGTATALNDSVEAALVARLYAPHVHASATKGCTGHTMGASGMLGALACCLALQEGLQAGSTGTGAVAPELPPLFQQQLQVQSRQRPATLAAAHAFGFGGNNAVLVFGQGR
jgi:3-oxoacyl-[acyl-carrier-protein] synthase I